MIKFNQHRSVAKISESALNAFTISKQKETFFPPATDSTSNHCE